MLGWFAKFVQIWQDHRHAIIKSVNCAGLRRGHWSSSGRALELQTNPITEKAHTWTFSWFKGTSFLVLPHVRLLIKSWRLRDFFLFYFWWLVATWENLLTKTQSHDSVHLCISRSLLPRWPSSAPLQLLATAHECPGRTLHTHPCHIDTVTVSARKKRTLTERRREELRSFSIWSMLYFLLYFSACVQYFCPLCILLHGSVVGAMRRRQGAGAAPHTEMYYLVLTASSI